MKKTKKSQTEIFGLAIVVILLVVGMLLLLKFGGEETPEDIKNLNRLMSENFVNSILHTSTDCNNMQVQDILAEITVGSTEYCEIGGESISYKDYANITISNLINGSIANWKSFELTFYQDENNPVLRFNYSTCKTKTEDKFITPLKTGGLMYSKMKVCTS